MGRGESGNTGREIPTGVPVTASGHRGKKRGPLRSSKAAPFGKENSV